MAEWKTIRELIGITDFHEELREMKEVEHKNELLIAF
jgi:hypothetical protein